MLVFHLSPPGALTGNDLIGLSDAGLYGTLVWSDGTALRFTNWKDGEPSSDFNLRCVVMDSTSGKWEKADCGSVTAGVCKY